MTKQYNIIFNGNLCQDIFGCEYKGDMHAIQAAWRRLQKQSYLPERGGDLATFAKVSVCNPDALHTDPLAVIEYDGGVTIGGR